MKNFQGKIKNANFYRKFYLIFIGNGRLLNFINPFLYITVKSTAWKDNSKNNFRKNLKFSKIYLDEQVNSAFGDFLTAPLDVDKFELIDLDTEK